MKVLLSGTALFLVAFALQVAIWRIRLPKNQTIGILSLYTGLLVLFLLAQALGVFSNSRYFDLSLVEAIYLSLMVLSVLPGYVMVYGLVEVDSPSSRMALALESAGERGLPMHGFRRVISNEIFIWTRMTVLENGKQISRRGDRYFITPHGTRYMELFLLPRKLLGKSNYGG
jgi:hypothetical protein